MGYTRNTGQLSYLITNDGSGNITIPAAFTQGSVISSVLKADAAGKLVAAIAGTDYVAPAGLSAYVPTTRTLTINGTAYDLSADRSWTIVSGVSSFNTRTGAITLTSSDVTTALTFTPVTNARTLTINGTTYDLSADRSWSIVAGLSSFNTRTGAITLLDTDVTGALGYTPVTNARTITINGTTYDLSANRTWTVDTSSVTTRVIQKFTATASQTVFTITGGYTVGMVDVFLNGIKLDNAVDITASNGTTVTLTVAAALNDIVEVYKYGGQFIANNSLRQTTAFTATAAQTSFTVSYSVGFVDVFYNGSKLAASEFTATTGTAIVLATACVLNDIVEVVAYNYTVGAFTGVGGSGTVNYLSKWTATGTLNNSLIFDNGTNVGIGNTNTSYTLDVSGTLRNTTSAYFATTSGSVGIGTITPLTNTQIAATNGVTDSFGQLLVSTTNTATIDFGGQITLGGFYNGTTNQTAFGAIAGRKENATANNALGYLSFSTQNGTINERMRITSAGNVGIGTTSPLALTAFTSLEVKGSNAGLVGVSSSGGAAFGRMYASGNAVTIGTSTSSSLVLDTNDTARITILSTGNVGIGTTSPEGPLHINGAISGGYVGIAICNKVDAVGTTSGIDFGTDNSGCYNGGGNGQIAVTNNGAANKSEMNLRIWNGSSIVTGIKISDTGKVTFPTAQSKPAGVSSSTAITVNTSTFTTVASVTITTTGKQVFIVGSGDMNPSGGATWFYHSIFRDGTEIGRRVLAESASHSMNVPFSVCHIDQPSAGSHTYDIRVSQGGGYAATYGETGNIQAPTIFAVETI